MKAFDSRAYSISDFLEWKEKDQLVLSPKFQRKSVWSDNARSYLMDTIIRGLPMPKVFIRQKLNVQTRQSIREVVDGQQRLRTILSFVNDGFKINKKHNKKYGGLYFSQLDQIDDSIQSIMLNYEISTDLLVNMEDSKVLDIFSRLNSYSVVLNEQEKINANHFGSFKVLVDQLSHKYNDFWTDNRILTSSKILRMADANLVADLVIAMSAGIKSKKQIKISYSQFEDDFPYDDDLLRDQFDTCIETISKIFPDNGISSSEFRRIHIFYSLFTAVYHCLFGLEEMDYKRVDLNSANVFRVRNSLDEIEILFKMEDVTQLDGEKMQFLTDSRRATTDTSVRIRRCKYIIDHFEI
jgi:hypothetical protein